MSFLHIKSIAFSALLLSACGSPGDTDKQIYSDCGDGSAYPDLASSQCINIQAPLDHAAPDGETIELFVRKFPASGRRRGEVWLLAGGPGESGASYYADIDFFKDAFAGYDLIIPDHRGTGYSTKLCEPEETRGSKDGLALSGEEWGSCFGSLNAAPQRAREFSQRNAALDIDFLIDQLGSGQKTYVYAVSYGTSLALEYAGIAEKPVDGIILDSLTPARSDAENDLSHRSHTTNRVGQALLQRCAEDPSCPLGRDASTRYDALLADLDQGAVVSGMEAVPNGDLRQFLGLLLDAPEARKRIPAIIHALAEREPQASEVIKKAAEEYEAYWRPILRFEQAAFSIPLSGLISGSEFNSRPGLTPEEVAEEKKALGFTSPLPAHLANGGVPLYEAPPELDIKGAPPILVLHGTLDPKTPYDAALRRIEALKNHTAVSLVTLLDAPHAAYFSGKDCLIEPISNFVTDVASVQSSECLPDAVAITFD